MIEIFKTNPGETDFSLFADLPKNLYPEHSVRLKFGETIPTDFLIGCYYLSENKKIVARASLYNNPLLCYQNKLAFTIGNYECADHAPFASQLLSHLYDEAKSHKAEYLIGPMNGSTWENYRFSKEHDQPSFFLEPYHHLYYNDHFLNAGFSEIAFYYTNIDKNFNYNNPDIVAREKELISNGVVIRSIDLDRFEVEIERIFEFTTLAFETNFLYTPIDKEAFVRKYVQTKKFIDPAFTLIAEDRNGNLIGYYFCIEDFMNTTEKSLIVKTLARHPAPEWKGLGHVIGNIVYRNAIARGFKSALHPFIYQQGLSTTLSKHFSGVNYRNYALYGKEIERTLK